MFCRTSSAGALTGPDFCFIFSPCGYDEPDPPQSSRPKVCLRGPSRQFKGADQQGKQKHHDQGELDRRDAAREDARREGGLDGLHDAAEPHMPVAAIKLADLAAVRQRGVTRLAF